MEDIRQVIVPVDFHQHTDDLAEFAISIANKLGAQLTCVHVVEKAEYYSDYTVASSSEIDAELRGYAEKKMSALLDKFKTSCPGCTGVVLAGDIADCIVEYAKDREIDLIVIGTHGAKGIEKIMLGSVAERVLKRAHCPTLVFNPYKGERGYQITSSIGSTVQPI
jgi:nucleotide-binding universal stress UspA family protein